MDKKVKQRQLLEKRKWRRLDNTAKLFAAVAGEALSNVFRISVSLNDTVQPDLLKQSLSETLEEFDSFKVKLRRGFFWNYFEVNAREPLIEEESDYPCKYIDPHSSHLYLFRVSYFKRRINFEVFHALTDGMGAVNFMKRLTERYLELAISDVAAKSAGDVDEARETRGAIKNNVEECQDKKVGPEVTEELLIREEQLQEDGYLKYYKKRVKRRYGTESAMEVSGELLPLDCQSVVHGYLKLEDLKALCKNEGVSITKYLTALILWSLIQVYGEKESLKRPVAVNLPINLRTFFDSETMANFFAVTNIMWPSGTQPKSFSEVLKETGRQMDEKIVKDKLEETISYNVSNEKKWYVRIVPLIFKNLVTGWIFMRSSRAYTMTLSNLGPVKIAPEFSPFIENFKLILGVSKRQKLKCGVIAFEEHLCITFNSVLNDTRLSDYFFGFLREKGIAVTLESNGIVDKEHVKQTYPEHFYDRGRLKKFVNIFYLVLLTAALIVGAVNVATYALTQNWWSVIAIGGIAYVALTLRYSIMRRASLAGILVVQSLGAQALLALIDYMTGFQGWSFNFAIPSVILFDIIAAVFLILVNRMNWQSYFMYQIAITIFSFIPLVLWAAGLITRPLMSVITVIFAVSVMVVTVVRGDRSVKNELKRRFHF